MNNIIPDIVYLKKNMRWKLSPHCVHNIKYHIIWCTKYRKKVLGAEVEERLKTILVQKANDIGVGIEAMEVMPDHVHVFVVANPAIAPHHIVQQLKGISSKLLREEFSFLKSRIPTLWTRSYYMESIGAISEPTIKKYIENQKKRGQS
jgi:putative transposase